MSQPMSILPSNLHLIHFYLPSWNGRNQRFLQTIFKDWIWCLWNNNNKKSFFVDQLDDERSSFFKISSLSFCPHYLDSTRMFLHASLWLVSCIQTCVFSLQAQASSIVFFYPADRNNADREKKNGSTWYRMTFISFGYGKTVDDSKRVAHNKPSHLSTSSSRRVVGVRSILYAQHAFSF